METETYEAIHDGSVIEDEDEKKIDGSDDITEGEFDEEGLSLDELSEQPDEGEPPVPGTSLQLTFDVGGEPPTGSTLKLRGGSLPVDGIFQKGDILQLVVEARVGEVAFVDKLDPSGFVVAVERRQVASVLSARRA